MQHATGSAQLVSEFDAEPTTIVGVIAIEI